jgi:coatomer protein complex subunit alpha (xenin)
LQVLKVCDANKSNEQQLDYDDRNPFVVCTHTFKPIYRGQPMVRCGFCTAPFDPSFKGQVCKICKVAEVGFTGTGLQNSRQQRERGQSRKEESFDDY